VAAQIIVHITSAGERWDLLAWKYYGDATFYAAIIMANPLVLIAPVFEAGVSIVVPVIRNAPAAPISLPPWKRSTV